MKSKESASQRVNFSLTPANVDWVRSTAARYGINNSEVIRRVIKLALFSYVQEAYEYKEPGAFGLGMRALVAEKALPAPPTNGLWMDKLAYKMWREACTHYRVQMYIAHDMDEMPHGQGLARGINVAIDTLKLSNQKLLDAVMDSRNWELLEEKHQKELKEWALQAAETGTEPLGTAGRENATRLLEDALKVLTITN